MHWNSFAAIVRIVQRVGFELKTVKKALWGATSVSFIR